MSTPEGAIVEEEWGVRLGDSLIIRSTGIGYWGQRHAEQEVERVEHNAKLPNFGQPKTAEVVRRTVTRYWNATEWGRPDLTTSEGD